MVLCNLTGYEQTVTIPALWSKLLLSNRERTAFDGKLLPFDCLVLRK